jgi:hypothetical protein
LTFFHFSILNKVLLYNTTGLMKSLIAEIDVEFDFNLKLYYHTYRSSFFKVRKYARMSFAKFPWNQLIIQKFPLNTLNNLLLVSCKLTL